MVLKANTKLIILIATMVVGILVTYGLMKTSHDLISTSYNEDMFTKPLASFQSIYHLRDFVIEYYDKSNCFIKGSMASLPPTCVCLTGWNGPNCDIPDEVVRSVIGLNRTTERRQTRPRRLIYVLPLNEPLHWSLRAMQLLHDVVDVFVYGSLFNSSTSPNQLFQEQCKLEFGHQILFVWNLGDGDLNNGALSNHFKDLVLRTFFRLSEVRMDDLVVFSRRRQTSSRNVLLFLKLHDNFPEQIVLNYPRASQLSLYAPVDVCTVASLLRCCHFDISKLQTVASGDPFSNLSDRWVMLPP